MSTWQVQQGDSGLRLEKFQTRAPGSEKLTWAGLFGTFLEPVRAYVLYFPSRFDLPVDTEVAEALKAFGRNTPDTTSVNSWDGGDPEFGRVLALFKVESPPALIFAAGGKLQDVAQRRLEPDQLWAAVLTDQAVLSDRSQLAPAANALHELVVQSDPAVFAAYINDQKRDALLESIGQKAGGLRDQILKLKPKIMLPGGISIQLG